MECFMRGIFGRLLIVLLLPVMACAAVAWMVAYLPAIIVVYVAKGTILEYDDHLWRFERLTRIVAAFLKEENQ